MSDARIETVSQVLRDNGHNATGTGLTTDDLATAIVGALDEAAHEAATAAAAGDDADAGGDTAGGGATNPETPAGTGTEGGSAGAAS